MTCIPTDTTLLEWLRLLHKTRARVTTGHKRQQIDRAIRRLRDELSRRNGYWIEVNA